MGRKVETHPVFVFLRQLFIIISYLLSLSVNHYLEKKNRTYYNAG